MNNKKQFLFYFTTIFIFAISASEYAHAQFKIKSVKQIKEIPIGFNALFTTKTDKIIFSSENNKGLNVFDLNSKIQKKLNNESGSGFEPSISADGKTVFYKSFTFDDKGKRMASIIAQDISSGDKTVIISNQRNLSSVVFQNDQAVFLNNSKIKSYGLKQKKLLPNYYTAAFTNHNMDLVVFQNGTKKVLNPFGKDNYIWVSLSPDKQKVLFNKAGKGTYISDLQGNIITDLGKLEAANWSADGNWIVGMYQIDDGHKYISSQIVIVSANGKIKQSIELPDNKIALYPNISSNNSKIVFNNEEGSIYIISIKKKFMLFSKKDTN